MRLSFTLQWTSFGVKISKVSDLDLLENAVPPLQVKYVQSLLAISEQEVTFPKFLALLRVRLAFFVAVHTKLARRRIRRSGRSVDARYRVNLKCQDLAK